MGTPGHSPPRPDPDLIRTYNIDQGGPTTGPQGPRPLSAGRSTTGGGRTRSTEVGGPRSQSKVRQGAPLKLDLSYSHWLDRRRVPARHSGSGPDSTGTVKGRVTLWFANGTRVLCVSPRKDEGKGGKRRSSR